MGCPPVHGQRRPDEKVRKSLPLQDLGPELASHGVAAGSTGTARLFPGIRWRRLGQDPQGPDERGPVHRRQQREDAFLLLPLDGAAYRIAHAALPSQRQQVDPPVSRIWPALDQPAFLEFVEDADDATLVRANALGERGLGAPGPAGRVVSVTVVGVAAAPAHNPGNDVEANPVLVAPPSSGAIAGSNQPTG